MSETVDMSLESALQEVLASGLDPRTALERVVELMERAENASRATMMAAKEAERAHRRNAQAERAVREARNALVRQVHGDHPKLSLRDLGSLIGVAPQNVRPILDAR